MSTEEDTPIYWAVVEGRDYKPRDRFPYDPCAETRMAWLEATEYIELLEQRIEKARDIYYNPWSYGVDENNRDPNELADYMESELYIGYVKG